MKRWRPLVWLVVSVVCFIAAMYFWRLGDQWQTSKPSESAAIVPPAAQTNQAANPQMRMEFSYVKSASTAPVVALNPPATNAVVAKSTNAFRYRLSNSTQKIGALSHNRHAILLENAFIDTTNSQALAIPDSLRSHGDPGAYLVQANGPMNNALRALIVGAGATIVSYIPNNAYLVTGSEAVAAQLSRNFTVLAWEPYFKVKAALMPAALSGQSVAAVNVAVFPGAEEQIRPTLQKMGVLIASESSTPIGKLFVLQNVRDIAALANLSGIEEIEPSFKPILANDLTRVIMNDSADVFTPTNYLGLTGSNVLVAVADSWVPTNALTQFNPDLMNLIGDTATFPVGIADLEGHATHVGGIIAASGSNSPINAIGSQPGANFRGKAPQATLFALPIFSPFFTDATLQQATARTNATISNNSWGYGTGDYNLAAASYDQAVRDSQPGATGPQPVIYVFAAGNDGNGGDDGQGGFPDSLLSPAVAKNVISVGASELPRNIATNVTQCDSCVTNGCSTNQPWLGMTSSSNEVARFSARGNVGIGVEGDFGRFKPDVIAPGTFVVSTRSMTWDTNAYYNPTSHNVNVSSDVVQTNSLNKRSVFVPCDAVELDIFSTSIFPTNVPMPIYVRANNFPDFTTFDFLGTNVVQMPPDHPLSPVDTTWFYGIGNSTSNQPVQYETTTDIIETNSLGTYWDVLRTNLNDQLVSSNGQVLYRYESGTSMAAPAVAGTLALMEDYFTNRANLIPSPALMKALLINGARSINPIYDFQVQNTINYQGWGLVNLPNSLPMGITNSFGAAAPMLFVDQDPTNALATGDSRTFFVSVDPSAQIQPLRVTLVWTDPPGNPVASIKLVNNLDLVVTNFDDPTNPVVYIGNDILGGDTINQIFDTSDTNAVPNWDNINNVENVYIPQQQVGTNYSITVIAHDVNVNAVTTHTNGIVQDYALVISSGDGGITNALTLTNGAVIADSYAANLTAVTNQFPEAPDFSGGILVNQHVGASSPLQGTNTLGLGAVNQTDWGNNGQITLGVSNQWHFYVITNTMGTNATQSFTNAAFATFLPPNLSVTSGGVNATDPNGATRPEADIDLYVARGPNAWGLTNLDPTVIAAADKSLSRGGTEIITYTDAAPNEVFYIGVKAEDQEAAEYDFLALFALNPFSTLGPNGEEYLHGINVPTVIPDGSATKPGVAMTIALAIQPVTVRHVVVTNIMEHENFGDLFGTLSHNQEIAVLNNHTFGDGTTNQTFVYDDLDETTPDGKHSDGPQTLQNFIGVPGVGLWLLTEVDNAQSHTGRVDNVFIRLDPQQGTNGVVATIPPGGTFTDFIDVPPEATNLTVCIDFLNGSPGPVQLYLRFGAVPTLLSYDYTKVINGPIGDCLTVGRSDLPPLRPGRYYVLIKNPTLVPQTVRLRWSFGLDPNGAIPTPITSTNSVMPLLDDATTNNSIFITNNQNIVTVNVGVVLKHPRVSDLDLTLISPEGQRILLFENRGGLSATNMGHLNITTNFFGSQSAGDFNASSNVLSPVPNAGVLIIDYNFHEVPDTIDVYYDGVDIFSPGLVANPAPPVGGTPGTFIIPYGPGASTSLTIVINQGGNSLTNTAWEYTPRVVTEDFTYLTFTDNTNLTEIPIKFAVPPYDALIEGTNFALSDFELATNGQYIPPGTTNIADLSGGWLLTTNDVFVRTNYFAGTNLLSMATNEVSVVTDPATAAGGSNYLALANGSISRNISLAPGKQYTINYVYRGPGIAGWWRGEGNATDSGDPETLGNNGSLIGRFNFPAGEVGQAFALEDSGLAFQFAGTNTYVQVRQSGSLDVGAGSGFTVEGWINPTNTTFQQPLVEWLARAPTNTVVNGQSISNFVVQAGPFLNRANGHYYYLLGQTNWATSELWANALGGHLAEIDDANEQNWIYDTFAQFAGSNYTMWIGLTNDNASGTNFVWSTGAGTPVYTNWDFGQPTNCASSHFVAILGPTNGLPGLWTVLDNNGLTCNGNPANKPLGVVEVNQIQTNGVQFWISVTNAATPGNGRLYANIYDTNGVPHELFSPPDLIQSNVYQHVALTYNTNTGVAKFYYAGTNVTTTNIGVFVPKTGGDVLLGKDMSRATNNFFWGRMDEISIYSRFLSPAEIAAIYRISATTSNRNIGKFDPAITPSESLGEAQVSFNGTTNFIFGNNRNWQVQGFTLQATSNSVPLQFTGLEPGILLDSFNVAEHPPGNLYYLPEQPLQALVGSNAFGNWTLEIRDARTGAISTNAELESWQLQFILETNIAPPIQIFPQGLGTNTVPPGQIAYFTVFVPSWANFATNILVSATAPVDLLFNQNNPPGTGAPGDFTFVNNALTGSQVIGAVPPTTPPLIPGQAYYLGVRNNGAVPSTVVVQVNFNIITLTNGVPVTSLLGTNDLEQPFIFNVHSNATEATFQLLQLVGNADLVLRKGLPLPGLLDADYGSFSGSNADETIYVLTNSLPVPLSAGLWYLDVIKRDQANNPTAPNAVRYAVLAKELTNAPQVINLTNRVPLNFTVGPGAALTNFFRFSVTNLPLTGATNLGIHFEVFNQSGNGDLTMQTNALPLASPFLQSSRLPGNNAEIIFIRTNSAVTNLNADWYLGVPNNETNPISFTILAEIDTNSFVAFPTAEGSGAYTRGGALSTSVYHVRTLFDSGAGSLRTGVNSLTNGGTIVFDVSGSINLTAPLFITNSFLTIAGQTAPSNGVTVAGAPTYVRNAHDIIMRYLRFRPSSSATNPVVWSSSFEGGVAQIEYQSPTNFDGGWHVDSGSVDLLTNGPPVAGSVPYDGNYFIDINGGSPGQISTNIPTVSGTTYSVSFAYTKNPNAIFATSAALLANGQVLGIARDNQANFFSALNWHTTSFVFTATSPSTLLTFSSTNTPGASGLFLDAVGIKVVGSPNNFDSLQFTNVSNVIVDHISAEYAGNDNVSVLNSSNMTVQWSVLAESLDATNVTSGGSEIRYGSGDVTFHHNLYADNYSGNPTIGENVSLDFVNNVVFNWGIFSGLSTNDLASNPGGLTNFLNYSANYLIAGSNSVFPNIAFRSGTADTWIFQTNNVIDTNRNSILDGANTSWGMFLNPYTPFSHAFDIPPPTAPDEAFIAYEKVLDFAGTSLFSRDLLDRSIVQRTRLQPVNTNIISPLAGMVSWWPAENNGNDIAGANNGNPTPGITYATGEVRKAFVLDGANYIPIAPSSNLDLGAQNGLTIEGWINPSIDYGLPILEWDSASQDGLQLWVESGLKLYANLTGSSSGGHIISTSPGVLVLSTWQHVAITFDKSSGNAVLYVNGVANVTQNFGGVIPQTAYPAYHVNIGLRSAISVGTYYYSGLIDELGIYNRALSACEIAAIYNAGTAGKQSLLSSSNVVSTTSPLPYADVDQDGIPDFWEITLNEFPTNFSPNLDRDGDGYTDLEEYMNWLGVPHAVALHDTSTNVDLYTLSGNTGNLLFGVANGTNGSVYLTNVNACLGGNPHIAVFTPTNNFGNGTNCGFGSFTYMVTNTDTMAYFGPVTVSVFVSSVPITNVSITNILIFTNPPDIIMDEMTTNTVINAASPTNGVTYILLNPPTWATIDPNTGLITLTPLEPDGPTNVVITTVATDSSIPPIHATNTFSVTVNEVNRPPVFIDTPPDLTNSALVPITVTNAATDPDIPINPLTYQLLNPPFDATIDTNTGIITWTPTSGEAPGTYIITTVVTDTNAFALNNNSLSTTNTFTIVVVPAIGPFAFTQPAQAVTGTNAQLNGMATPNGFSTMAWFEWGTNTLYGNQTAPVSVGASFNVVYTTNTIAGLTANVPYHFRLVVSNGFGGIVTGFDQILDEAGIVAWGADYVKQIEVPPGLSNIVAIAGAYDHSLALKNNGTVVAWGDNTFTQTNVPPGLNNVLAVAGGQYSSMALKNNGTVTAWGGNILSVTNVPAGLNNVVMIAGGTYASLALKNNGAVVSWGANFFSLTNLPAGLNNVVEVAGGSYHSLAIRNDGTVVAWGDDSAGQTNVPPSATNVVAIAGGNYHSLALRSDGTVVAWGDNSSGQTNVPPGLSNVVAVAAGGFHSLVLKSDGTVVSWGDNTAGQSDIPAGLSNVVAISSGYFHSLALTPTLLSTNPIVLDITNGIPRTNTVFGGSIVYYRVDVPVDADAATNTLLFALNGPLNVWYSTNTPPTTGLPDDFQLMTNVFIGTSVVDTATSPQLLAGTTYYLGLQNTNSFAVSYVVQVDFHLVPISQTNTVPISGIIHTNINGTNGFLLVWFAPTNDLFQVQWSSGLPPSWSTFTNIIGFNTFIDPTNSEFEFFDDGSQTGGSLGFGRFYRLILLGSAPAPTPLTGGVPVSNSIPSGTVSFYQVNVPTNADFATNSLISGTGPLNVWFSTNNPPTVTNADDFLLITNLPSGFSTLGGTSSPQLIPGGTYYLGVQNTNAVTVNYTVQVDFDLVPTGPTTNSVPISTITQTNINGTNGFLLVWFAPTNALFQVQWTAGLPPSWTTFTNIIGFHTFISPTNSEFEFFDDGSQTGGSLGVGRIYRLIQLNSSPVTTNPTNPVPPISSITTTNIGGTNNFLLVWFASTNELFQVQWSAGLPPSWFTFTNIISYDTFISATNSKFIFLDDGSQTGGFGTARYYRLIPANSTNLSGSIIQLANGVPVNFTTAGGQTNFFSFDITQTNAAVLFELYNLTGTGDLTLQRNSLPVTAPYFTNSSNPGTNYEQIVVRTNASVPNINAISWFLGVPNQSSNSISYTIRAFIPTNGLLVSGLPLGTLTSRPGGSNVQLVLSPTINGEKYEIRTNSSLISPNWGAVTDIVASGTATTFTDPSAPSGVSLFYWVVQVP